MISLKKSGQRAVGLLEPTPEPKWTWPSPQAYACGRFVRPQEGKVRVFTRKGVARPIFSRSI